MRNNKRMNDQELTVLVHNEVEWRKMLWKKVESFEGKQAIMDKQLFGLKIKVAFFGGIFGTLGGSLITFFTRNH